MGYHDLRHTCATLLVLGNVPLFNVAQWLGHSNSKTTGKFYAHVDAMSHDSTANVIGNLLNNNSMQMTKYIQNALANSDTEQIALAFSQLDPCAQRKNT